MNQTENVKNLVNRAIDRANELQDHENALLKSDEALLIGPGSKLDSMGFVNLVVALEEELKSDLGLDLSLMDELYATEQWHDGRFTVGHLVSFWGKLASEKQRGIQSQA